MNSVPWRKTLCFRLFVFGEKVLLALNAATTSGMKDGQEAEEEERII